VHLLDEQGRLLAELSGPLGIRTNNQAEYSALIAALEFAHAGQIDRLRVYADSELLVNQINGTYKVKNLELKLLHHKACRLIAGLKFFSIQQIPRDQNREADRLANKAMDQSSSPAHSRKKSSPYPSKVKAVFRDGCFKPIEPVAIPEGARLTLILVPSAADDTA
jgi:ribonuclease HI